MKDLVSCFIFPCFDFQEMERGEENSCILWALLCFFFTEAIRKVSVYLQILLENAELLFFLSNFRR